MMRFANLTKKLKRLLVKTKSLIVVIYMFSMLALASLLGSCAHTAEPIEIQTITVERTIPVLPRPRPISMRDIQFYVVNRDNLDQFLINISKSAGNVVFFAITPKGYENLALNMNQLRRYIEDQQSLLIYYEEMAGKENVGTGNN